MECDREKSAIATVGGTEAVIKRPRWAVFGVVNFFDCDLFLVSATESRKGRG
jgi:hypothetical protein